MTRLIYGTQAMRNLVLQKVNNKMPRYAYLNTSLLGKEHALSTGKLPAGCPETVWLSNKLARHNFDVYLA